MALVIPRLQGTCCPGWGWGVLPPPLAAGVSGSSLPCSYLPGPARRKRGRRRAHPARPPGSAPPWGAPGAWAAPLASWPWNPSLVAREKDVDRGVHLSAFSWALPPAQQTPTHPPEPRSRGSPPRSVPPLRARFASGPPNDRQHGARGFSARLHLCLSFPVKASSAPTASPWRAYRAASAAENPLPLPVAARPRPQARGAHFLPPLASVRPSSRGHAPY